MKEVKVILNGQEYTAQIAKLNNREWRLIVIGHPSAPIVYNHSPEKCIESLRLQWVDRSSNNRFELA